MPLYVLKCSKYDHGEIEVQCSYEKAKNYECPVCACDMIIVPCRSQFKVNGFSAENGYHRPEFSGVTGQDMSWD